MWLLAIVRGPCAGEARPGGVAGSRRTATREKRRASSISCDVGSDCASGVSCGRLCGGLYLDDDWPCVLLRAFELIACTTLPRRSWFLLGETIIYNRLLARSQALSGLEGAKEQWNIGTVEVNHSTDARSTPPRPRPEHGPEHRFWTGSQACWPGADVERQSQLRRLEAVPPQPGFRITFTP